MSDSTQRMSQLTTSEILSEMGFFVPPPFAPAPPIAAAVPQAYVGYNGFGFDD